MGVGGEVQNLKGHL